MNEIEYNLDGTFSPVLSGIGAVLIATALLNPVGGPLIRESNLLVRRPYIQVADESTYNSLSAGITGGYMEASEGFEERVGDFYARLLGKQEPLGAQFEKVLYENLWDLYES